MRTTLRGIARREFLALLPMLGSRPALADSHTGPTRFDIPLNDGWLFGGRSTAAALQPKFDDSAFSAVTLPHCVSKLSWQDWDPSSWQDLWIYRRHCSLPPEFRNRRVFVEFDAVMVGASPVINGHALPEHLGGYLPFRYEITDWLIDRDNVLAVQVDSRWKNVPPEGSPAGPRSIDYLEPGGIVRGARLWAVPDVFISGVFAKPVKVLDADRHVVVTCSIDARIAPGKPVQISAELVDGDRAISRSEQPLKLDKPGNAETTLTLSNLGNIALWHVDTPRLYDVVTTLSVDGKPIHNHRVRIGFRDARFEVDGFFLNGSRFQLFGLNRHELYPYAGGAMPRRVLHRDALILRHQLNCNVVRCSHYPQSEEFLDACDELGLMVWEEIPGWQYLGDETWKELAIRDVRDMVRRDRNHPAIIIWGVRINESRNDPALYSRTTDLAKSLDDSRPTSGSMTPSSARNWREEWHEDVFAFDDYHSAPDGTVGIREPLPGVPYMLAEAVGQFNYSEGKTFSSIYRRTADASLQQEQALRHAQAHDRAAAYTRCAGVIAWCAFEYGSLVNAYRAVKYPGVADVFRIPKLGATFYEAQVSPRVRPVIAANFYWYFGPQTPHGPGNHAAVFSNCDRLEIFIGGKRHAAVQPDRAGFPHLKYPPFFCDLASDGAPGDLRIDGYVDGKLALSKSFSADTSKDQFLLAADDRDLIGDGSDATRLVFQCVDRYGAPRPFTGGEVHFKIEGPGSILGDNPFNLADSGGAGAVWIRSALKSSGRILVTAAHSSLGTKSVEIMVHS